MENHMTEFNTFCDKNNNSRKAMKHSEYSQSD